MKRLRNRIRGFAIVTAIFILVVLATLGAFILNVFSSQQIGSAIDLDGVRAYQAARAGIEWGIYQVQATPAYNFSYGTPAVAVGSASPDLRACPATASFTPAAPTLSTFTVTVTCTQIAGTSGSPNVYSLVSVACNGPDAGNCPNTVTPGAYYVERRLEVAF
ncbi:MAG: agglutinin biogenesis protein MshP [Rhodocyclales bacterium]|nr:agglutinin biogenesis protein MshP [Rhodocyclales bacterium]